MPETLLAFKTMTTARHISAEQQLTMFDQRHLRGQVIALKNFHMITMITEADVIRPSISAGAKQPESIHGRPLEVDSLAIAIRRCESIDARERLRFQILVRQNAVRSESSPQVSALLRQ